MFKSMTGYGKVEQIVEKKKITVEIRSFNSKTFDVNMKIPLHYREKENLLRNELLHVAQRGKLEVTITATSHEAKPAASINKNVFIAYYKQLDNVLHIIGSSAKKANVTAAILRMPDVMESVSDELSETEWQDIFTCFQQAIITFDKFRINEGKALMTDIITHVLRIETLLEDVKIYEQQRIMQLKQRINANLLSILQDTNYDKNRFEQELIYYIEKIDITEEKIRLAQHCLHFRQTADTEETQGRKLGFIAQEMGREINTLGSKANHVEIQKIVVQMKDELEKIKEQLLNVL